MYSDGGGVALLGRGDSEGAHMPDQSWKAVNERCRVRELGVECVYRVAWGFFNDGLGCKFGLEGRRNACVKRRSGNA